MYFLHSKHCQTSLTCLMPGSVGVLPGPPAGGRRVLPVRGPAPDRAGLHRARPHLREDPDGLLPQLRPQLPHHQVHSFISTLTNMDKHHVHVCSLQGSGSASGPPCSASSSWPWTGPPLSGWWRRSHGETSTLCCCSRYFTRFTEEAFASLVGIIFIVESLKKIFSKSKWNSFVCETAKLFPQR